MGTGEERTDRMKQPLFQKLKEYDKTMLPMHMPGHKRNLALSGEGGYLAALCAECDITEIAGFDNLAEPEGLLLSLKERAAKLWKSEEAYPLVNGSTCGILASIYTTVPRGGKVIVARNCHKSVYNGLQLVDAQVTYLMPEWDDMLGCYGEITSKAVEKALEETADAKLVIVTSPTYEGKISDIHAICKAAHAKGVPVLVDSAHGAHLGFGGFPEGATECGADLVVHSLHKTLPCLTQTAMLHRNGTLVSGEALQSAINLFQTSSPSYLLLASVDGCIGLLEEWGTELFRTWEEALSEFYKGAKLLQKIKLVGTAPDRDPSKIILSTVGTDLTGTTLMGKLRTECCIELEMAGETYGLAMTGPGDTKRSLAQLLKALLDIDGQCNAGEEWKKMYPAAPITHISIGEAVRADSEEVLIRDTVGRIAAEHIWAYPPGIPVVIAGEEITEELVEYLTEKRKHGVELHRKSGVCKGELLIHVAVFEDGVNKTEKIQVPQT